MCKLVAETGGDAGRLSHSTEASIWWVKETKRREGAGFRPVPLEGLHGCFLKGDVFRSWDSFPVRPSLLISPHHLPSNLPCLTI